MKCQCYLRDFMDFVLSYQFDYYVKNATYNIMFAKTCKRVNCELWYLFILKWCVSKLITERYLIFEICKSWYFDRKMVYTIYLVWVCMQVMSRFQIIFPDIHYTTKNIFSCSKFLSYAYTCLLNIVVKNWEKLFLSFPKKWNV